MGEEKVVVNKNWAICNHKDCDKKDNCLRYDEKDKQVYDMKIACQIHGLFIGR